jgi:hypothetical protein
MWANNLWLKTRLPPGVDLDSFGGTVHVEWDREAGMRRLGSAILH